MKCLIIGGNRFVGLRVAVALDARPSTELEIINRTGQAAHVKNAVIHKGDRKDLAAAHLERDWDVVIDFACFNQAEAEASVKFFGQVGSYIFISTLSVYERGANLTEDRFQAEKWDLAKPATGDYQDGKRRAEAVFAQQNQLPVLAVRLPLILGPDDYTNRLDFHIDRVQRSEAIYIPNPAAKISMIHAQDAADFILWAIDRKLTGPLNVCSPDSISMNALMGQIELVTGIKPKLASAEHEDNHSPYAPAGDWWMNSERLVRAGFKVRPISDWLPGLIGTPPTYKPRFVH
jgi:nucleoside-diphosphate-sugar epimerase